jgi:glycosyltransferase involved in cell wall biosynthesis
MSTILSMMLADKVGSYTEDYAIRSRILKNFLSKFRLMIPPLPRLNIRESGKVFAELKGLKKQKKILFGFAGRFVEEKGFDVLFKSIPLVLETLPDAYFVFAGETNIAYEDFFKKNQADYEVVKEKVSLLGLLKGPDLENFYNLIDFIVIPSRSDCFNLVQAEAMLCKKPSVVSDIPGARYLVKSSGYGLLFSSGNAEDLSKSIINIYKERTKIMKNYSKLSEILNRTKLILNARQFLG